ncbi:MAG: lipopolysaccharide biosynthesis protein RfbH [Thermoplasmata archaeon]
MDEQEIKENIFSLVKEYYDKKKGKEYKKGDKINYAQPIFDHREINSVIDALLKGWFGMSDKAREFQNRISEYLNVHKTFLANSGSSANLVAVSSLLSHKLEDPIKKKSEVLTPAVTFPTTLNPIIQNGLKPVLVDVDFNTLNADPEQLKENCSKDTSLMFLPHTLGNPNEMDLIMDLVEDYDLYLIEDNCDAFGSEYDGKKTGSFGTMSTLSFYPAHHITMGEGGAISIKENDLKLERAIRSIRDWGRDCWCQGDEQSKLGACGKRFDWEIDGEAYDHRYIYSHIGYNLKPTEIMAAMGPAQMDRIEYMVSKRRKNYQYLYDKLKEYDDLLMIHTAYEKSNPSWFAFPMTIRDEAGFSRREITTYLEDKNIQTRLIFAGNITKQPAYKSVDFKIPFDLKNSKKVMHDSFFIGIHPSLEEAHLDYVHEVFERFFTEVKE